MTQDPNSSKISSRGPSTKGGRERVQERASKISKKSLLSNLQNIAKESAEIHQERPRPSGERNIKKEIEALDKKQTIWLWLYRAWLLYKVWTDLPTSMIFHPESFQGFLPPRFLSPFFVFPFALFVISPYLIQLWGMYKKSLKTTNFSMSLHWIYFWMAMLQIAAITLTVVKFEKFKALVTFYVARYFGLEIELPSREDYTQLALYTIGQSLFHFIVTLGGGIKYRSYLMQRKKLEKEKSE